MEIPCSASDSDPSRDRTFFAHVWTRAITSSYELEPATFTRCSVVPSPSRCAWASVKPGTTVAPRKSITVVDGLASDLASASEPTNTIRPARTASAETTGRALSTV